MTNQSVHFVHLSDTHVGRTREFRLHGACTHARTIAVIEAINAIEAPVDFVIHTGDVATDADITGDDDASTRLAHSLLRRIQYPLHLVNGNHDNVAHLSSSFGQALGTPLVSGQRNRACHFVYSSEQFIILDARAEPEIDPRGRLPDDQLSAFDDLVASTSEPLTIFLHYPPISLDSRWIDNEMLVVNGESFHERLAAMSDRVRGVFFGHVHHGIHVVRDGILYSSVGSTSCHFDAWPHSTDAGGSASPHAYFNYVSLNRVEVTIKQHVVHVP